MGIVYMILIVIGGILYSHYKQMGEASGGGCGTLLVIIMFACGIALAFAFGGALDSTGIGLAAGAAFCDLAYAFMMKGSEGDLYSDKDGLKIGMFFLILFPLNFLIGILEPSEYKKAVVIIFMSLLAYIILVFKIGCFRKEEEIQDEPEQDEYTED